MEENAVFHYFIFYGPWPYLSGFLQHFFPSSHMRFCLKRQNTSTCKTPTRVCLLNQSLFLTFPWTNCSGKQSCLAIAQCYSWAAVGHNSLPSIREGKKFQLPSTQDTLRDIWLKEACSAWSHQRGVCREGREGRRWKWETRQQRCWF